MDDPGPNVPEFSVSEISGAIKSTLEGAFGRVRVRGEVTEVRRYSRTRAASSPRSCGKAPPPAPG